MINNDRRNFIFKSTMLAASGVLTACGGGAAAGLAGTTPEPTPAGVDPAPAPTETALAAVVSASAPIAGATILLSGSSVLRNAPYCLGYAFRRGDVPAGKAVAGDTGSMQVIPKNLWPDGSLKFAVIAGQADVSAAADTTVTLKLIAASAVPTGMTTAKLRATEIVAEVACGAYGTVNWAGADWDAPFQTWVQGPVMSSWIYRKPVGSDKHLVAWLEVRLWASGAVEVLPWIENGYLGVAAPTNKSATFAFTLGKTQRMSAAIDLKHHQRTPLINGSALSYWLAADPGVTARHNTAYLQATELVPTYMAKVEASAAALSRLPLTFTPLQAGSFNFDGDWMGASGYQDPIGLLPQHDVLYLTSDAKIAHAGVIRNGFSAGRYSLHYRDETTNRPLRFSSYPTLNIGDGQGFKDTGGSTTNSYTPTPTGGSGPTWDVAHSPSVGYLAYLVTGRWYFMEEVQFATTTNYLGNGDNYALRVGSKGIVKPAAGAWQTRSCAWDWRARVQALCVTPDADTALRAEFVASVEANIDYFHSTYIAQPNNPYGWIKPGEGYTDGLRVGSPWQQDFVTAAFGYSVSLGLPVSAAAIAKLEAFFQWKARSVVGRLGPKGAFWYINADPYTMAISPVSMPDYDKGTGPWYESDAAVYNASFAVAPAWMGNVEGTLAGEIMPGAEALWGNLMPAIAYAVRHNVPGAKAAYDRLLGANNWPALRSAFNSRPVWAVAPAGVSETVVPVVPAPVQTVTNPGAPAWAGNAPLNAWIEIPGTAGAGGTNIDSYSGWAKLPNGKLAIALAGGHGDGTRNSVAVINLMANAPAWAEVGAPSPTHTYETAYQPDGKPTTSHTYYSTMWVPTTNRLMRVGAKYVSGGGNTSFGTVDGFNLDTNTWDRAGTYADVPLGNVGTQYNPVTNKVLMSTGSGYYDPVTGAFTGIAAGGVNMPRAPWAWDSTRKQFFGMCYGDGQGYSLGLGPVTVKIAGDVASQITIANSAAKSQFAADVPQYAAMEYDPLNDSFLFYSGSLSGTVGRIYKVTPNNTNVWDMSLFAYGTGGVAPTQTVGSGIMNKFSFIPELKGIVMMTNPQSNLYFMRLG